MRNHQGNRPKFHRRGPRTNNGPNDRFQNNRSKDQGNKNNQQTEQNDNHPSGEHFKRKFIKRDQQNGPRRGGKFEKKA
jgi:hypothetical protein